MIQPLSVFGPKSRAEFLMSREVVVPLIDALPKSLRPRVGKYLRQGQIIFAFMEYTRDVIGDQFGVSGGSAILTDGEYYWRRDAAEYVETYGIAVGGSVLSHMRAKNWKIEKMPFERVVQLDIELRKLIL